MVNLLSAWKKFKDGSLFSYQINASRREKQVALVVAGHLEQARALCDVLSIPFELSCGNSILMRVKSS